MHDPLAAVVRVIHIFTAVAWVGGVFLWGMVIAPRVLAKGPPQIRRPFAEAVIPAMTRFYQISGVLAILSGIVLVGQINGWSDYFGTFRDGAYGMWLGFGAFSAILMAIVGFGMTAPAGKKLLSAMQTASTPPTPEQQATLGALGKKMGMLGMAAILLGTLSLIGMALAVNVAR